MAAGNGRQGREDGSVGVPWQSQFAFYCNDGWYRRSAQSSRLTGSHEPNSANNFQSYSNLLAVSSNLSQLLIVIRFL